MAVADSLLKDQVVFVEGAPRSGTTMLISLLASHPEIAAIVSETHFFDRGVDCLFDNHENDPAEGTYLASYVRREELCDGVRDLFDRILITMRDRVNPEARFVAEKTPAQPEAYAKTLARKLECYPDARYVHVVRDREGVVRSLSGAPWARGSSAEFADRWQAAVETVRTTLDGHAAYLEVPYHDLAASPERTMAGVFEWLAIEHDDQVLARVRAVSRERISAHGPGASQESDPRAMLDSVRRGIAGLARLAARRIRNPKSDGRGRGVAEELMAAVRTGDRRRVMDLTGEELLLEFRSGAGDLRAEGEEARVSLLDLGGVLFSRQFISESWSASANGPSTHMTVAAMRGDGTRTDASISVIVRGGRAVQVSVISAGDPSGRPPAEWTRSDPA